MNDHTFFAYLKDYGEAQYFLYGGPPKLTRIRVLRAIYSESQHYNLNQAIGAIPLSCRFQAD